MTRVFISYRREDTSGHAGRLLYPLRRRYGRAHVFMDVTGIAPGDEYAPVIERTIAASDVVLVVIGREWLTCRNAAGGRRLDDPGDFLRLEITSALRVGRKIIPVLVEDAPLPPESEVPPDLRPLFAHQAMPLNDRSWDRDVEDLMRAIGPGTITGNRRVWFGAGGVAAAGILALVLNGLLQVNVPRVTGHTWQDADALLESAGFVRGDLLPGVRGIAAIGTVIGQNPPAQTRARRGRRVDLTVAAEEGEAGIPRIETPDLKGLSLTQARVELDKKGLILGSIGFVEVTEGATDVVVQQTPAAGTSVPLGDSVSFDLSRHREEAKDTATVPFVIGQTKEVAVSTIVSARLKARVVYIVVDSSTATGTALKLVPSQGETVTAGTEVEVQVGRRPLRAIQTIDWRNIRVNPAALRR